MQGGYIHQKQRGEILGYLPPVEFEAACLMSAGS
jgi:hypothetical protein